MTKASTKSEKSSRKGPLLIIFGALDDGKPKAGTFNGQDVDVAIKAAESLGFATLHVNDTQTHDLATKLSPGRIHSTGRDFLPSIRPNLYAQLVEVAQAQGIAISKRGSSERAVTSQSAESAHNKSPDGHRFPASWDDIQIGDLVLSQDSDPQEGWWEAIVTKSHGETCTLKWRQPQRPQRRGFLKHKYNLGLVWPGVDFPVEAGASKAIASEYPHNWAAIGPEHIVLAKEEGPMEQWWEAAAIKTEGENITLRWRDFQRLPELTRRRSALALIHPNPAGAKAPKASAA
jgi:hypothetical protein